MDTVPATVPQNTALPADVTRSVLGGGKGARRTESEGDLSLHMASKEGNLVAVRSLLDGGAEVNKRDTVSHETPLDLASGRGRYEVAKLLIKYGANVNSRDKYGSTLLHKASRSGHLDVVRLLLGHGADPNAAKQDQWTPLHLASTYRRLGGPIAVRTRIRKRGITKHKRPLLDWDSPYTQRELRVTTSYLRPAEPPRPRDAKTKMRIKRCILLTPLVWCHHSRRRTVYICIHVGDTEL